MRITQYVIGHITPVSYLSHDRVNNTITVYNNRSKSAREHGKYGLKTRFNRLPKYIKQEGYEAFKNIVIRVYKQQLSEQESQKKASSNFIKNNLQKTSFVNNFKGISMLAKETKRLAVIVDEMRVTERSSCWKQLNEDLKSDKLVGIVLYSILRGVYLEDDAASVAIVSGKHVASAVYKDRSNEAIKLGVQLMEKIVDQTEMVERVVTTHKSKSKVTYKVSDEVFNNIDELTKDVANSEFYATPMTIRPKDWTFDYSTGKFTGGYLNKQFQIIRGYKGQPRWLCKQTHLLKTLNYIQGVPYRINKEVFEAVKKDLKPPVIEPDESKKDFESREGKFRAIRMALEIAEIYQDEEEIYFPHNYDSRGRIYPISILFNTQGTKEIKGILEFANGVELTEGGLNQMFAYLSSTFGNDKASYKDRVKHGKELFKSNTPYTDADDEKYIYLQVFNSIKAYYAGEKCHVAIHRDGTCNGLQHLSALTRCNRGAKSVNLTETEGRCDIYQEVAAMAYEILNKSGFDGLFTKIEGMIAGSEDQDWSEALQHIKEQLQESQGQIALEMFEGKTGRKVCKRPTMIKPYGGTSEGICGYIHDEVKGINSRLAYEPYWAERDKRIVNPFTRLMAETTKKSVNSIVKGGNEFEQWAKETGSLIGKSKKLPYWVTPDNFKVELNNFLQEKVKFDFQIGRGRKMSVTLKNPTNKIDVRGIRNCISPNIVHSLDATHLRNTLSTAVENGITDLWFIHDSFGCNPNQIDKLDSIIRGEFVNIYSGDYLRCELENKFKQQNQSVKPIPIVGDFDVKEVMKNEYFFS